MHHVPSHVARGSAETEKKRMFLRATGVGGKRSTIESERNSPNARVRTMSTSATTDVSRVHGTAFVGATGQSRRDAPRPSPESAVRPATPRPTGGGVVAKPNSRCVASYVQVCAVCGSAPLTVSCNVVCSRPTRCRPITPADRAQCDAHIMPRVCRRRPKNAVCAVLRA